MKNFLSMLIVLVFGASAPFSLADTVSATASYTYRLNLWPGAYPSEDAALSDYINSLNNTSQCNSGSPSVCVHAGGSQPIDANSWYRQLLNALNNPAGWVTVTKSSTGLTCPPNQGWTLSGSSCVRPDCLSGQTRLSDGSCGRDCNAIKNTSYSGYIPATANPATVCQDGCNATVVSATNQASVGGTQVIAGTFSYSGGSCTGNNITGGTPPTCPAGQCVGLINGANACFTCADVNKTATTYTATSDTTLKTTTYNADSSTSTSVTDTTTGTTSPVQTTPKPEQQTFCEQNPTDLSCLKTDSVPATPVSEPGLEATPTGAASFSFIKDFVNITPTNFSHTSQCPTSSFSWNGKTYVIDQHCALINNNWGIFAASMMAVWTALSMFIVLKA